MELSSVPFNPAAAGMLSVDQARERLAVNEPGDEFTFWTCDGDVEAVYAKGWAEGEVLAAAPVWLRVGDRLFQLTREAAQQLGSTAKANKRYQEFIPVELLSELVTWALREGLHKKNGDGLQLKLLLSGTGKPGPFLRGPGAGEVPLAVAQTRATVTPFRNLRLLDAVLLAVRAKYGHAIADGACVDYKLFSSLEHTSFRIVLPALQQLVGDDAWCYGIEVSNSSTGAKQLMLAGYLFRLESTGGVTDVDHAAGGFARRGSTPEMAYAWAAEAAEFVLDGPQEAFGSLRALAGSDVDREYGGVLEQLFRDSPVSAELKLQILAVLEQQQDPVTMLSLARATSVEANAPGRTWREVRSLHDLAGHIVHQGGGMCRGQLEHGCRRLLARDFEPPAV